MFPSSFQVPQKMIARVRQYVWSLRLGLPWILCAHWNQRRHCHHRRGRAVRSSASRGLDLGRRSSELSGYVYIYNRTIFKGATYPNKHGGESFHHFYILVLWITPGRRPATPSKGIAGDRPLTVCFMASSC